MMNSEVLDSLAKYLDINIKICMEANHDKSWYELKANRDYNMWIILEGEVRLEYNNKEYTLKPHDLFFFYPQVLYKAKSISKTCRFIFVHFDASIGNNNRVLNGFPFGGLIKEHEIKNEINLFINSYLIYQKEETLSGLYLKGSFIIMLSQIIKYQYQKRFNLTTNDLGKRSIARLYPALNYISHNLHQPIYIKDLAASTSMSEKYFITFFKDAIGITPYSYILQLKMQKALEYLYEYKYSITEVASLVGYEDLYTFSNAFKKVYGIAPSKIV